MSVTCDKIVGYSLDVSSAFKNLSSDERTDILYNDNSFGIKSYDEDDIEENDITILHDGMSGKYTKLVYVLAVDYEADTEAEELGVVINNIFSKVEIPSDIKEKLYSVYNRIFKSDSLDSVKLEYILHWH